MLIVLIALEHLDLSFSSYLIIWLQFQNVNSKRSYNPNFHNSIIETTSYGTLNILISINTLILIDIIYNTSIFIILMYFNIKYLLIPLAKISKTFSKTQHQTTSFNTGPSNIYVSQLSIHRTKILFFLILSVCGPTSTLILIKSNSIFS